MLRGLLLDLFGRVVQSPADASARPVALRCRELVEVLCAGTTLSSARRGRLHAMLRLLREYADQRDVLGLLAREHHYSKSYVSHFFKEASGVGLSDLLGYLRVAKAEHLLLTSDTTMLEISAGCGFSDVKYFTRTFVDWFHRSPADYRRQHQPETLRDNELSTVDGAEVAELVRTHQQQVASPATDGPRLSVTPLLLKNLGSRLDPLTSPYGDRDESKPPPNEHAPKHLVPIRVTKADLDGGFLVDGLASFDQVQATPCLVVEYGSGPATRELIDAIVNRTDSANRPPIWLTYSTFHDRAGVDDVIAKVRIDHGVDIQPIMMP